MTRYENKVSGQPYRIAKCSRCEKRRRVYVAIYGGGWSRRCRPCIEHDEKIMAKGGVSTFLRPSRIRDF